MSRSIIGLTGKKQSGKDTAASILIREYDFLSLAFADEIKAFIFKMYPMIREEHLWGEKKEEYIESLDTTPRKLMQSIGEGMRTIDPAIWIRPISTDLFNNPHANIVITDVRHDNEIKLIRYLGGVIWNVKRYPYTMVDTNPSENSITLEPDGTLHNLGTLDDFYSVVRHMWKSYSKHEGA